jgi:hypothetical protein
MRFSGRHGWDAFRLREHRHEVLVRTALLWKATSRPPASDLAFGILTLAGKLFFRACQNIEPRRVSFQPES